MFYLIYNYYKYKISKPLKNSKLRYFIESQNQHPSIFNLFSLFNNKVFWSTKITNIHLIILLKYLGRVSMYCITFFISLYMLYKSYINFTLFNYLYIDWIFYLCSIIFSYLFKKYNIHVNHLAPYHTNYSIEYNLINTQPLVQFQDEFILLHKLYKLNYCLILPYTPVKHNWTLVQYNSYNKNFWYTHILNKFIFLSKNTIPYAYETLNWNKQSYKYIFWLNFKIKFFLPTLNMFKWIYKYSGLPKTLYGDLNKYSWLYKLSPQSFIQINYFNNTINYKNLYQKWYVNASLYKYNQMSWSIKYMLHPSISLNILPYPNLIYFNMKNMKNINILGAYCSYTTLNKPSYKFLRRIFTKSLLISVIPDMRGINNKYIFI